MTLSTELDREDVQPYFIWDVPVTTGELRRLLVHPELHVRALWLGRLLREARYHDVWRFVKLDQLVRDYPAVRRHLGRQRGFWDFLIDGWRADGLLPE